MFIFCKLKFYIQEHYLMLPLSFCQIISILFSEISLSETDIDLLIVFHSFQWELFLKKYRGEVRKDVVELWSLNEMFTYCNKHCCRLLFLFVCNCKVSVSLAKKGETKRARLTCCLHSSYERYQFLFFCFTGEGNHISKTEIIMIFKKKAR